MSVIKHPVVLTIAGSDPSAGAGVQADIKTISALGGYGCMAITALVVENTKRVVSLNPVSAKLIEEQCEIVFEDFDIDSVKLGMLPDIECVKTVAKVLKKHKPKFVVWDPVMAATSGDSLITGKSVVDVLVEELMPISDILTPNLIELAQLTKVEPSDIKSEDDLKAKAEELVAKGAKCVIAKGGHLSDKESVDWLVWEGGSHRYARERVDTNNTHGSGCTFSSAIATLRPQCETLEETLEKAKDYIQKSIEGSKRWKLGKGHGPLRHFHANSPYFDM